MNCLGFECRMRMKKQIVLTVAFICVMCGLSHEGLCRGDDASVGAAKSLQAAFRHVAKSVTPAVVNVSTVRIMREQETPPPTHPFFEQHPLRQFFGDDFFREFFGRPSGPSRIEGMGSGFIFDARGYVLTNRHVIKGASEIQVVLSPKRKYKASVVGADEKTDVAVIKISGGQFHSAKLGNSDTLEVGDWVLAIGSPFGLMKTVTAGIVSAKGLTNIGILPSEDFIQTDAAINRGNSGGPLVNIDGQVVGMNTAIVSEGSGFLGIGLAISANKIKSVLSRIMDGSERPPAGGRRQTEPRRQPQRDLDNSGPQDPRYRQLPRPQSGGSDI